MLSFALPWVAVAGGVLGLIPLLLHFLVRRPPARADLPTARFLTPDPRTRVALDRRPRDLLLLLLRVLFLLLLGMGLAGPRLVLERSGTATWVLLDTSPGMAPVWEEALAAAREVLAGVEGDARLLAPGTAAGEIPLGPFLDGEPVPPPEATGGGGYLEQLRDLRRRLEAEQGLDSVEVVLVTRPRREAWTPGLGGVRDRLYPGALRVVAVGDEVVATGPSLGEGAAVPSAPALVVRPGGEIGPYVEAALEALGREVEVALPGESGPPDAPGRLRVFPAGSDARGALEAASLGDTVIVEAGHPLGPEAPPLWEVAGGLPPGPGSAVLLAEEVRVPGAALLPGGPVHGVRIPLTGEDGRPAAAAVPSGQGCVVVAGFRLEGGELPLQPGYPRLLEALASACLHPSRGEGALDRGALEILGGRGLAARVGLEGLSPGEGRDLSRWFLLAALLLAILEALLGYRRP